MPATDTPRPPALTFILPTRNRRQWVGRAIESCLQADRPEFPVEVLLMDGQSSDGSYEELQARYGRDARVRLARQPEPKGFMPACFSALLLVRTPYATFMYDDDVLAPFWADMPREMKRRRAEFVMGFGAHGSLESVVPFERVRQLRVVTPSFLLRAYFGCGHQLSPRGLPFSPICCLTRTDRLREWKEELEEFTRGRPMREYFMMKRNAGPDLMIYLYSIASHEGEITVFDGAVAQFSSHVESITSGLEATDLLAGYWLAQVWLCGRLRRLRQGADAGWCSAYAVRQGVRLLLKRLGRRRVAWAGALLGEVVFLTARALCGAGAASFVKSSLALLLPRRRRPQFGLSTRSELLIP